jgi:hypothetical protein
VNIGMVLMKGKLIDNLKNDIEKDNFLALCCFCFYSAENHDDGYFLQGNGQVCTLSRFQTITNRPAAVTRF